MTTLCGTTEPFNPITFIALNAELTFKERPPEQILRVDVTSLRARCKSMGFGCPAQSEFPS